MSASHEQQIEDNTIRKIVAIVFFCAAVLLVGFATYRGYRVWKRDHLIVRAQKYAAKSDLRNAALSLQQALQLNPRSLDACRLMAALTEAAHSPAALLWRNRVVELNPGSTEDRLALVQTAMIYRDYVSATNALAGVSAEGKKTAAYHNLAGTVAGAANQLAEAEAHFLEAARLEPTNLVPQLSLAVMYLHGTNAATMDQARANLERLSVNPSYPAFRRQALRELVIDAMRLKQTERASALSKELVHQTNSIFSDRLLRLDVLRQAKDPEFNAALARCQHDAVNDPGTIHELANWQMARTSPGDALTWLRTLPDNLQTNQPVTLLEAECLAQIQDWPGLQTWVEKQNWTDLDFIRHALLARAFRAQSLDAAARGEWQQAMTSANGQKERLVMLLLLATPWKWQSESEGILWAIVNQYPREQWAFSALMRTLVAGGRTRALMMLLTQQSKRVPSDLRLKNDLALVALLLDAQELKPNALAREVYERNPTNSSYASTYAFSLYLQKKNPEALKVLEQLGPAELENPSIAGYYGLLLTAAGNSTKAAKYFDLASRSQMLPEERRLFEQAKMGP